MASKSVHVPAQIFVEDVVGDIAPERLRVIEDQLVAGSADEWIHEDALPQRVLRRLLQLKLRSSTAAGVAAELRGRGLTDDEVARALRVLLVTEPGHAHVSELSDIGYLLWMETDNELGRVRRAHYDVMPLDPVYTIPLKLRLPSERTAGASRHPESPPAPVRPYPYSRADAEAVTALTAHLAPRVSAVLGGERRVRDHPVMAPICALVATVDAALRHKALRSRHADPRVLPAAFYAVLDALSLCEHRATAERILLRDHAHHIHIDATQAPERFTSPGWRGGLGLFVHNDDGLLVRVNHRRRNEVLPRVLHCLALGEPH